MLGKFRQKYEQGAYEPIARAIPLFLAVPALALLAVDLDRYERNSAFHHIHHRQYLILDAVALSFVGLTIIFNLAYVTISRYGKMPAWFLTSMDCVLALATTILGEMVIDIRASGNSCFPPLGECGGSTQNIMSATAALLIIISVLHHSLWVSACKKVFTKFRQRRKASRMEAVVADPEGLSFSNDILSRESPKIIEPVSAEPDAMSFSNEIPPRENPTVMEPGSAKPDAMSFSKEILPRESPTIMEPVFRRT